MRNLFLLLAVIGCTAPVKENSEVKRGFYAYEKRSFDAGSWREADFLERGSMIDDLLGSKRLLGLTEPEVIDLLGDPTEHDSLSVSYVVVTDTGGFFRPSMHYILVVDFDGVQRTVSKVWMTD